MKKILPLFGLLDIIILVRNYKHIIPPATGWTHFPLMTIGSTLLYLSLIFSAYFLIVQRKAGLWLTYGQFPLRMIFLILSFGFLLPLFNTQGYSYKTLSGVLVGLEVLRLIFTILIHRKYY